MTKRKLSLPETSTVIRGNGDAVVELRQSGALVGEINFSSILGSLFRSLGWFDKKRITSGK